MERQGHILLLHWLLQCQERKAAEAAEKAQAAAKKEEERRKKQDLQHTLHSL